MTVDQEIVLALVRMAVSGPSTGSGAGIPTDCDWAGVMDVAFEQGVAGVCFEAVELRQAQLPNLPEDAGWPDSDTLLEWYGQVEYLKRDYREYVRAIASLAKEYASAGIEMMVLKGYGLSLDWPVPSHRPVGDIDVYLFGKWREGDALMASRGVSVDYGHHHHSVFGWNGQMVENHYDMVNRYSDRDGRAVDDLLKGLATEGRREVFVDGVRVFMPGATFNGVFLLRHSAAHFAGSHITLRHLLDWAMFVDKSWREIDWALVVEWARRMGQLRFLMCLNALSVDVLGISEEKFQALALERDAELERRVLEDILRPTFCEKGSGFVFKFRRLRANRWKRDLVSSEAYVTRMLRLGLSHLRRPERQLDRRS